MKVGILVLRQALAVGMPSAQHPPAVADTRHLRQGSKRPARDDKVLRCLHMSRATPVSRYTLRVNLKSGSDVRRFCEVNADKKDNVYVRQPAEEQCVKVSYHLSGQRHVKVDGGPAMFVMHQDRPGWIRTEEPVWSKSLENFASLLPYKKEPADAIFEADLPALSGNAIALVEVSIGRRFGPKGCTEDNVQETTLRQQVYPVPGSPSQLSVCVRLLLLAPGSSI